MIHISKSAPRHRVHVLVSVRVRVRVFVYVRVCACTRPLYPQLLDPVTRFQWALVQARVQGVYACVLVQEVNS